MYIILVYVHMRIESIHFPFRNTHINLMQAATVAAVAATVEKCSVSIPSILQLATKEWVFICVVVCSVCIIRDGVVHFQNSSCVYAHTINTYVCMHKFTTTYKHTIHTDARTAHPLSNIGLPHALFQHYYHYPIAVHCRSSILKSI